MSSGKRPLYVNHDEFVQQSRSCFVELERQQQRGNFLPRGSVFHVFRHLLGAEVTACIETKLNRLILHAAFSEALGWCRGCRGRCASSKHNKVSPPGTQSTTFAQLTARARRKVRSYKHQQVDLFRAFVQALGGLDLCRNERKRGQKHGLNK